MRNFVQTHLQKTVFWGGSQVTCFSRDPSHYSTGSYIPFLQGSHMQKQYHRRTTLRTWPWKMQERDAEWSAPDYRASHPRCFVPLGMTVAQRYDVPQDWLWDACYMAGVCLGSRCEGYRSKECPHYCPVWSARKLSYDKQQSTLFMSLEIPWGFHTQAVLRSLAGLMSCKKVSVQGFLWVGKVWLVFA